MHAMAYMTRKDVTSSMRQVSSMTPARLASRILLVLGLAHLSVSHEQVVFPLNSENFEHATQAASGMTTGYW